MGRAGPDTALGWAALTGDVALAELCLARGAQPNIKAAKGSTPLHMATWNADHDEIVALLLEAGADANMTNAAGLSPLEQAQWFDELERGSAATQVYDMDEWRTQWSRPAAGRAATIARLERATGAKDVASGADAAVKDEATEDGGASADMASDRGVGRRGVDEEDDDDEHAEMS